MAVAYDLVLEDAILSREATKRRARPFVLGVFKTGTDSGPALNEHLVARKTVSTLAPEPSPTSQTTNSPRAASNRSRKRSCFTYNASASATGPITG